MSSYRRAVVALALLGLVPNPWGSLDAADRKERLDGLSVSLAATEETSLEAGLYSFRLVLRNVGSENVRASLVLTRFSLGYLKILYRRPPGPFVELTYPREWYPLPFPHPGTTFVDLAPGETTGVDLLVGADPGHERIIFHEPGDYEIKVVLRSLTRETERIFETEPLLVHVLPMDGRFRDLSSLWDYEMVALAQGDLRRARLREVAERGVRIIEGAPDSPYARALQPELLRVLDISCRAAPGTDAKLEEIRRRLEAASAAKGQGRR